MGTDSTVSAEEVPNSASSVYGRSNEQDIPISRADYNTLSDDRKARVVEGQITDVPMSWVNEDTGNVEWITEFVLVYKPSGECEVVPTPPTTSGTPTIAQTIAKTTGVSEEQVRKVLPMTGSMSSNWLIVAGISVASLAGYLMFKNKRTGKTMLLAVLVTGGVGVSSTALASSAEFLQIIDNIKIQLDSNFSHTAPEDECWEYVGYIPEIASVPRNEVPSVELPRLDIDIPNEAPTHKLPTANIEVLEDVVAKGSVVVRFVNTDGVELIAQEVDTPETVVSTTKRKQVTINGDATVISDTKLSGATYDTTDLVKDKIVAEDGTEWYYKGLKEGDVEKSIVVEGVTVITYIYERATTDIPNEAPTHSLPEAQIENISPVEERGSVTAHYVDEQGNVIKDSNNFVVNELVNTVTRIKLTANGVSTLEEAVTSTGATYDAEPVKPATINFGGNVYEYVRVHEDSADVAGDVPVGSTDVTFVYRHVPQVTTRQETSQTIGNVNVRYVDTYGNEIKDMVKLIENGVVSNTTTTITMTDGVETGQQDSVVPTNLEYNTSTLKLDSIEYNGSTYLFKELKQGDSETGVVPEGTTTITYIYDLSPTTTEITSTPVYGNVVTRYINEVTGEEIVTGSNIVTQGVVANDVTTTAKNHKGEVVSTDTVRTPTGLTYDTTSDKAQKDAEIAQLRTPATTYINTATGEAVTPDTIASAVKTITLQISHDSPNSRGFLIVPDEFEYFNGNRVNTHVKHLLKSVPYSEENMLMARTAMGSYVNNNNYSTEVDELFPLWTDGGIVYGFNSEGKKVSYTDVPPTTIFYFNEGDIENFKAEMYALRVQKTKDDAVSFLTKDGYDLSTLQVLQDVDTTPDWFYNPMYIVSATKVYDTSSTLNQQVPYIFTRVDVSEQGGVEEGTKVVTYYYKPSDVTWTPEDDVSLTLSSSSVATVARDD